MIDGLNPALELERFAQPKWDRLGVVMPPFSIEADPRFMYISDDTRRALSKVSFMVEAGQGASVVVGEVGTGKTTLASWFHSRYQRRPDFVAARVDEPPKRSGLLLLRRIAAEFDLRTRRATEDQLNEFRGFLVRQAEKGVLPLIIIDEAHELGVEQFVELRRMLNFRDPKGGKAFQLILLGRPELDINLRDVPDFNDRVATRSSLDPRPRDTVADRSDCWRQPTRVSARSYRRSHFAIWRETRGYPPASAYSAASLPGNVDVNADHIDRPLSTFPGNTRATVAWRIISESIPERHPGAVT